MEESHETTQQGEMEESHETSQQGEMEESHETTQHGEMEESHETTQQGEMEESHDTIQQGEMEESYEKAQQGEMEESYETSQQGEMEESHDTTQQGEMEESHETSQQGQIDGPHRKYAVPVMDEINENGSLGVDITYTIPDKVQLMNQLNESDKPQIVQLPVSPECPHIHIRADGLNDPQYRVPAIVFNPYDFAEPPPSLLLDGSPIPPRYVLNANVHCDISYSRLIDIVAYFMMYLYNEGMLKARPDLVYMQSIRSDDTMMFDGVTEATDESLGGNESNDGNESDESDENEVMDMMWILDRMWLMKSREI